MKDAIKGLWRRFWHFCYPAIVLCWGAEGYVIGVRDRKALSAVLGVLFVILGLSMFCYESEKLRNEEGHVTKSEPTRDLTEKEADIYDKWILSEATDTGETLETLTTTFQDNQLL